MLKHWLVSTNWPSLPESLALIHNAGGVAVIVHPLRYHMTVTKLRKLIVEFKDSGGKAIEVISGNAGANKSINLQAMPDNMISPHRSVRISTIPTATITGLDIW